MIVIVQVTVLVVQVTVLVVIYSADQPVPHPGCGAS